MVLRLEKVVPRRSGAGLEETLGGELSGYNERASSSYLSKIIRKKGEQVSGLDSVAENTLL